MRKIIVSIVPLVVSLFIASSLYGITPIQEDFRFLDQSYTYKEITPSRRKIEETKHFHLNEVSGLIVERSLTSINGELTERERAWWFTDERQNNHFRLALMPNGNYVVTAMARVASGYKGVGMNETIRGFNFATEHNYNAASNGRLRISSGPLVARGQVNESMFWRKTWRWTEIDLEAFNTQYRSVGGTVELDDELKFMEPLLGVWEGTDSEGRNHRNMFVKHSPRWVLEFWRIGGADGDGPPGTNIAGVDNLSNGTISRSYMGAQGFAQHAGRYEPEGSGTVIQFQGNNYLIREVSGDTMTVTWKSLEGTEYVETRKYQLKRSTN